MKKPTNSDFEKTQKNEPRLLFAFPPDAPMLATHLMFYDEKLRFDPPVTVTRPTLPPLDQYVSMLQRIWTDGQLTNHGPYAVDLETNLRDQLQSPFCRVTSSGTTALMLGLAASKISGKVIVPPFTFVGTHHALHWCGLTPVFADIEPNGWGLAPDAVEAAVATGVEAILGVHLFGIPLQVDALAKISDRSGLNLGFDAAHAMGASWQGKSLATFGDWSALSFHSTKLMHTIEGGAVATASEDLDGTVASLRDFGFDADDQVKHPGLNGKMNEFEAAMGLLQLQQLDNEIAQRRVIHHQYQESLADIPGLHIGLPPAECQWNYAYAPIRINQAEFGSSRDDLLECLERHGVLARKYFFPLGNELPWYRENSINASENFPNAVAASEETLCLPIFGQLKTAMVERIIEIIQGHSAAS